MICGEEDLKNLKDFIEENNIICDTDLSNPYIDLADIPITPCVFKLVAIRGKPITREQVMELITGEEPLFEDANDNESGLDRRGDRGSLMNIFYRTGYSWLSTWVYTDGTIGGNHTYLESYPELDEILYEYGHLGRKYPFLDMVISYTWFNDVCCGYCEDARNFKYLDLSSYCEKPLKYENYHGDKDGFYFVESYCASRSLTHVCSKFGNAFKLTLWIHDGKVEVLFKDSAISKFKEYDSLYSSREYEFMFSRGLYRYGNTCVCDREFVEECFEYIGKPKSEVDKCIEDGCILPFKDEIVITKNYFIEIYNKYIKDYDI